MTRDEAIKNIQSTWNTLNDLYPLSKQAFDMAIWALGTVDQLQKERDVALEALSQHTQHVGNVRISCDGCEYTSVYDCDEVLAIKALSSVEPTLYGYNIEHLKLIAHVFQKENLPPERVAEVLMDIGRIVEIIRDEFEETFRKAVEQCKI